MLNQIEWAAKEVERQKDSPLAVYDMYLALRTAICMSQTTGSPSIGDAMAIAYLVKPDLNTFADGDNFRRIPVIFASGGIGTSASSVPDAVERLFIHGSDSDPTDFAHHLLSIHPWVDGNGRTAAILYNWLNGTLENPVPLPEWDWDNHQAQVEKKVACNV